MFRPSGPRHSRRTRTSRTGRRHATASALERLEEKSLLSTFTVTSALDNGLNNNPLAGSLRKAIIDANGTSGKDIIDFQIGNGGFASILPMSALPAITDPVEIRGYSQGGSAPNALAQGDNAVIYIQLDGVVAGKNVDGLVIDNTPDCLITGLDIVHFGRHGVTIQGAGSTGNHVEGNFIGVDSSGAAAAGNAQAGVILLDSASKNTIGGATPAQRNVISGNFSPNVCLIDAGTSNNTVVNNYIGTDAAGTKKVGPGLDGVYIQAASHNTIGGTSSNGRNVISGNTNHGVRMVLGATDNTVVNNFIGTDAYGFKALPNGIDGVQILESPGNHIGRLVPFGSNVISGNANHGVEIRGSKASGNTVEDNLIGVDRIDASAVPNGVDGVHIEDASNNTLSTNFISGNTQRGVSIKQESGSATGNRLVGNIIGTDSIGGPTIGVQLVGVAIEDAAQNTVGGTTKADRNIISANGQTGVAVQATAGGLAMGNQIQGNFIGTDLNGITAVPNGAFGIAIYDAWGTTVGGTASGAGNLVSGNSNVGILLNTFAAQTVEGTLIQGNLVGTDVTGTKALPNSYGIYADNGARNTTIGGTESGSRNVISGNFAGVVFSDGKAKGTYFNQIVGNYIGTDVSGTLALGNSYGVAFTDASSFSTVGGTTPEARNIISGNTSIGVYITKDAGGLVDHISVVGNYVGTDLTGTAALGNGIAGIVIENGAFSNTIGGTAPGAGNLISANGWIGLFIDDSKNQGTTDTLVQGNYVGTDVSGTKALGNGNTGIGLTAGSTTIGGVLPGAGNLISGNKGHGIGVEQPTATLNYILGNRIGTDATGILPLGNLGDGINIAVGASDNQIGSTTQGAGNVIAFNAGAGVNVVDGFRDIISGNSIYDNGALGIDLGGNGVSPNDKTISVGGPNVQTDAPVLTSAVSMNGVTTVTGTYEVVTLPNYAFTLEFYASPTPDPTGFGEGKMFLGVGSVQLDAQGKGSFTATLFQSVPAGQFISAIAIDLVNNTSEFSHAVQVAGPPVPAGITVTPMAGLSTSEAGGTATFSVVLNSVPTADVTLVLTSSNPGEGNVQPAFLTFTPANALVPQVITVTGQDDAVNDGDIAYSIITGPASSADPVYNGLDASDVQLTNLDDEVPAPGKIIVTPVSGLSTTESGGTATFTVVLATAPKADVSIVLSTSDPSEGNVGQVVLTFTPANALVPQVVKVSGADDFVADGDVAYSIITAPAISADPAYNGLDPDDVALTNVDDDSPGVVVTASPGNFTTETGGTATFSVRLTSIPTADVTIALSSSDPTEGMVSPVLLTFTPANALIPQTVTVHGVDDAILDGDIAYSIVTAAATSADPTYNGLDPADVALVNLDNEVPPPAQILITPASLLVTTESGGTATFTVALGTVPTADVSIALNSSDVSEGTVSPIVLTFTPANALVPQAVTIAGVNDALIDGDVPYAIITAPATSADPAYNGLNAPDVAVTNLDDESAGQAKVIVSAISTLTSEAGGQATFTVALATIPTADVSIILASSDASEGSVAPAVLTFSPGNALIPQVVTVTGVDDLIDDGDVAYSIVTSAAISADAAYNGLGVDDVALVNLDNDQAGIVVTAVPNSFTTEAGGTATFTVVLRTVPTADVTIALGSSDPTEGTVSPLLTFTPANALTPQTVTVKGVDDAILDGDIAHSVVTAAAASADPSYDGLDPADVPLVNLDNEVPPPAQIVIKPTSSLVTTESGGTATFTVALSKVPTADVSIVLSSSDPSEGTVSPVVLTFTPANALLPQTVTVKGVDDALIDGDIAYAIITAPASSADPTFNGLDAPDVSVTNLDNESAAQAKIVVTPTSGLATTEAGGTASFTVVLGSVPTADVSIVLSSGNAAEGTVSPAVLTFTPANALVPQVVTVKGIDDLIDDGDVAYAILSSPAVSADAAYNGLDPADVALVNIDDDRAGVTVSVASDSVTTEAGGTTSITVVLDSKPSANVTLTVSSSDSTEGEVQPMLVTFTPDDALVPHVLIVKGVDDTIDDGDVTYSIVIGPADSGDPNYNLIDAPDVLVTNVDDDDPGLIGFAASSFAVDESAGTATVAVTRTGGLAGGPTIDLVTRDGSARAVSDYAETRVTLTFAPGETTKVVTIPISDDQLDEPDESLTLVLENPEGGASLGGSPTATLTILDDDGQVTVGVDDLKTNEGSGESPKEVHFTVKLSGPSEKPVEVGYSTGGGSAEAGADYLAVSGALTFQPGETEKSIAVPILGDYLSESAEAFGVRLSDASNAVIAKALGLGMIDDDDARVVLSVDDTRTTEGQSAVFLVHLSSPSGAPVTVSYATADLTAKGALDYLATAGTLTFQPGETVKAIAVPALRDSLDERTEHFGLVLSSPLGASLGRSQAVGSIVDVTPPRVTGVQPLGFRPSPGELRIAFSEALDATRASRTGNYTVKTAGGDGRFGTADDQVVPIARAVYDRALHTVRLVPRNPGALRQGLLVTVNGTAPTSLCDLAGNHLDGNADGRPGGNYSVVVKPAQSLSMARAQTSRALPHAHAAVRLSGARRAR